MQVIVLAAGMGRRLRPFTNFVPKCLVQLNGEKLIDNFFRAFRKSGLDDVVFVVGYKAELIENQLGHSYMGIDLDYVRNPAYESSSSAYSLWLARNEISDEPFIIADGDILFDPLILDELVTCSFGECLVADPQFTDSGEEVKVAEENGIVKRLGKQVVNHYRIVGEAVGLYKFSGKFSESLVRGLEKYLKDNGKNSEFEDVLNSLLPFFEMHYVTTDGLKWVDIDFPEDLQRARMLYKTFTGNKQNTEVKETKTLPKENEEF